MPIGKLHNEKVANISSRIFKTEDADIITYWQYDTTMKQYCVVENFDESDKKIYVIEVLYEGKNILKSKHDVITTGALIFEICNTLKISKVHKDFFDYRQLVKYLVKRAIGDKMKVEDETIFETIDEASGGGCLIADVGTHYGDYKCYDINNSYNKFFLDYKMPTNPKYATIDAIDKKKMTNLYKLNILNKKDTFAFKLGRKWFTGFDIKIFDLYSISYELVKEQNNCVVFETFDTDGFEFIEKINEMKQKTSKENNFVRYTLLKLMLSSLWGIICRFHLTTEKAEGKRIDHKYFYEKEPLTGVNIYKHPDGIYKFITGMMKPFLLAYARLRLLKVVKAIRDDGFKVVYCHTDSVVTNAPEKYFEIGNDVGMWKIEKNKTETFGVIVDRIAAKRWITSDSEGQKN